ncbi:J domain-containing protein [Rhodothermus profundi]|uniref:DnaJ domain-containing protein n=1 Tax=Rhodothermus profundi TaxID=633813 RepID=A0A1M6SLY0_9BACT|nr:J domain-containing protein [Rhodothermus profundi]SHK45794.1 DnaJ domain-containing protein [Rhodothermus profundi]
MKKDFKSTFGEIDAAEAENIRSVFRALGERVDHALSKLRIYKQEDKRAQLFGSIAGAAAALLTGGLGLGDLIIYPVVSSATRAALGPEETDMKRIYHKLSEALEKRAAMIVHFPDVVLSGEERDVIFRDLLLLYYVKKKPRSKLLEQIDNELAPKNMKLHILLDKLIHYIGNPDAREIDDLVFFCLFYYGLVNHKLYLSLREGREELELQLAWVLGQMDTMVTIFEAVEKQLIARHAATLELREPFTPEQVRQNYRRLMKACHPDRFPEATAEMKRQLEEKTRQLNEAYQFFRERLGF